MRNYRKSDLDEYHKMLSDRENMYFIIPFGIITSTIKESQASLNNAIEINAKGTSRRYCIALKESDKLIGAVGYEIAAETPVGKIADPMGWFLMPNYQNKGYMTEAVKRVLAFAFL